MIKINLLPASFRVLKKKKKRAAEPRSLSALPVKEIALGVGILFLILTAYFDFDYFRLTKKMARLKAGFIAGQPQIRELKALEQEVDGRLIPEKNFLKTQVLNKTPITHVLQKMSEALPEGMWLEKFSMNNAGQDRSFQIQGRVISVEGKTTIEQIEEYLQALKATIPSSQVTYSTSKQSLGQPISANPTTKQTAGQFPTTLFISDCKWRAD